MLRAARAGAKGESKRKRKAKAKGEVLHRNARLPDERPRLRADGRAARPGRLRADRRRRRCGRDRDQHVQRARARRGEAVHAARRDPPRGPRGRLPAGGRGRRLRRAAGRRRTPPALVRRRRRHRHPEHPPAADAGRRSRRAAHPSPARRSRSAGRRVVSAREWRGGPIRGRPTSRSSRAATSSAPSASCRTRAATSGCGRSADIVAEARRAVDTGRARNPAARTDRQPLPGAGRSARATSRRCSSGWRRSTGSSGSGSRARIRGTSRRG